MTISSMFPEHFLEAMDRIIHEIIDDIGSSHGQSPGRQGVRAHELNFHAVQQAAAERRRE